MTKTETEIETPATENHDPSARYEDLNPFKAGPGPLDRVAGKDRAQLEKAEAAAESAKRKADTIRTALSARQEGLEAARKQLTKAQARLGRLLSIDCSGGLQRAEQIVEQLYGTECTPVESQTLNLAMHDLAIWPAIASRLPGLIQKQEVIVREIESKLSTLESSK